MPKKKEEIDEVVEEIVEEVKEEKKVEKEGPRIYKSYNIKELKEDGGEEHPDYYLVKEYEDLYGEV